MSEVKNIERVTSLEDLFLSREFGKPLAARAAPVQDDLLFGVPPRAPLVPLVAVGTVGHSSTTHQRTIQIQSRNRLIATVSGVAAAVLIGVGLVSAIGKPGAPPTTAAGGKISGSGPNGGGGGVDGQTGVTPTSTPPISTPSGTSGSGVNLASDVTGPGGVTTKPATTTITITPGGNGKPPTVTISSTPPPASPGGGLLSPVVVLVGHLVITVGATATTAGTGLSGTLPALTPVTSGVVGSLGTTLSGLGASLVRFA